MAKKSNQPLSILVRRLSGKIRNFNTLAYQVASNQQRDYEVAKEWPRWFDQVGADLVEVGQAMRSKATEVDAYVARRAEDSEALMTLAQSLANFSTIFGPTGWNFEIRTHGDSDYIWTILQAANLAAFQEAVDRLDVNRKRELGLIDDDAKD